MVLLKKLEVFSYSEKISIHYKTVVTYVTRSYNVTPRSKRNLEQWREVKRVGGVGGNIPSVHLYI